MRVQNKLGGAQIHEFTKIYFKQAPWAHLDIAGMAFSKYGGALNSGGATGFGVRLLNKEKMSNFEQTLSIIKLQKNLVKIKNIFKNN